MRWRLVAIAVILTAAFAAQTAHASVIGLPANNIGLVGYWSFNEGTSTIAHDYSGNGNNGTLSGSTLPTWTAGKFGDALSFDGSTNYVQTGSTDILDSDYAGTVSFWIKTSTSDGMILSYSNLSDDNAAQVDWYISGGQLGMGMKRDAPGNWDSWVWNGTVNDNKWHHVVYVADGTNPVIVYVDGVPVTLSSFTNSGSGGASSDWVANSYGISSFTNMFVLGAEHRGSDAPDFFYSGTIDDVRVYGRALTATEVEGLYQSGLAKINTSQSPGTLSQGLVGWWTMDGADTVWSSPTAGVEYDRSGNGNTGTLNGMTQSGSPTVGKIGQALSFDGVSSYASIPYNAALCPPDITVSAWIYFNAATTATTYGGASINEMYMYGMFGTNWDGYTLYDDGGYLAFFVGGLHYAGFSPPLNVGQWYNVVGTYDGSTIKLYVNGAVSATSADTGGDACASGAPLLLGERGNGSSGYDALFNGRLDDVRVYDRALSTSEIEQLYNLGAGTHVNTSSVNLQRGSSVANGLVGYWTFDGSDISGSTIYDLSGNGNNGTNNGATPTIGKLGQALQFDGSSSYIDITGSSGVADNLPAMTVSAWIKTTDTSTLIQEVVAKIPSVNSPGTGWALGTGNVSGEPLILLQNCSSSCVYTAANAPTDVADGKWHQVVWTMTGNSLASQVVYIDGVAQSLSDYSNGTPSSFSNSTDIYIGADPGSGSNDQKFNGTIDDVRIYNRALSASEVQYLYNMGR